MALSDWTPKADIGTGVIVGVGLLVAPVVIPIVVAAARPVFKAAIKGGIMLYERASEVVAEACEVVEDLVAEAKAEVQDDLEATKS